MDKKDVAYIAALARLHLEDHELEGLTKDLAQILHYIDTLKDADVSRVEPTSHVLSLKNVFRKDQVKPSLKQDEALSFAVSSHKGFFKVPQVIE
ncbi:MAG: Asp-tRNA(Asn)/Glu-tRNA(Gln) amidotransferase subunit GatC [Candidatus Omnitrophota bacterium]|nr:Asp-tRNA(Asn)/Glu-tRNA(Gln) amidotransferase subunit GatC [Candidatus Omnitrophota bacterium]MDZ4243162.1 Asp-tRNA(Asn)/Glu-tRNA(Gln) amidotransferase subunit GatC [Candidatus Omnitrophota bacterium]